MKVCHTIDEHDFEQIHQFLSLRAYWCLNIPKHTLKTALSNSLCFVIKNEDGELLAFARVVSDYATFANLLDVFVLPEYRGASVGKTLINAVVEHPKLQGLRRFTLATKDAHGLYQQFGFKAPKFPDANMEIYLPNIYQD